MKLGIDIGNTRIGMAFLNGSKIKPFGGLLMQQSSKDITDQLARLLKVVLERHPETEEALIGSVVPKMTAVVEKACRQAGLKFVVIGRDIKIPIQNNYRAPKQVGIDRLLCAYAARELYGAPLIVIDFGTAITFEVVSKSGAYEGGLIIPGIQMSLDSLSQRTALLPRVEQVKKPEHLIGQNTQESILSGVLNGYGAMCDGLVDRFLKSQNKQSFKIILTGGYANLMKSLMVRKVQQVDEELVYKGMTLLVSDKK